jgi:hypothetical protein
MPKYDFSELQTLYNDAEDADRKDFAAKRTNILLVAGKHYSNKMDTTWDRIRENKNIAPEQKLKLVKNHIRRISDHYTNYIVGFAPGVYVAPKNASETQDQKIAQLNESVWQDIKDRYSMRERIRGWASDYVNIGEAIAKITFDPTGGVLLGYEYDVDERGQPVFDEFGQPSMKPVYSGEFVYDRIYGYNLLRDPDSKHIFESPYLIIRKLVDKDYLISIIPSEDKDTKNKIVEASKDTFNVFDSSNADYTIPKGKVEVREYYFRPDKEYPNGYFIMTTNTDKLPWEGELPAGVFPISFTSFKEIQGSPRGKSVIEDLRSTQSEINRAASMIAQTQITLGSDKILVQNGTNISHGGLVGGIRYFGYNGMPPTILPGRSGDQFINYLAQQIDELYRIADLSELNVDKDVPMEPYSLLFRSAKEKKKFSLYAEKFEGFLKEICMKSLKLAKYYYSDQMIINAAGKSEQINIPEFKSTTDLSFSIKLEEQSEDLESKLGKQISLTQALQYVGKQLGPDQVGMVLRNMPYANVEEITSSMTIDYDNIQNDILALDRGEQPSISTTVDAKYAIKWLTHRMKKPDFKFLEPQIQQNYEAYKQQYIQLEAQQMAQIQAAQSGFIPSGGYMVKCDMYIQSDPNDPTKTNRLMVPSEALLDLVKKLEAQNMSQSEVAKLPQQAQADLYSQLQAMNQPQQAFQPNQAGMPMGMPQMPMGGMG